MEYACRLQATGVTITRTKPNAEGSPFDIKTDFRVCQFKPYHPQFNSDVNPVIKYEDLVPRPDSRLAANVQVVTFENQLFVHKFMSEESEQCEFEAEVERYQMLKGCEGVPEFRGVVRRQGLLQGFLISYIEGDNLWTITREMIKGDPELLDITRRIIEVAVKLEQRGIYHQDLKCQNIVRRRSDGDIYFIDFGAGTTEGMYPTEHGAKIRRDGANAADAMYILGMTLRQLWTSAHPKEDVQLDCVRNQSVCMIIEDCIKRRFQTIETLCGEHYGEKSTYWNTKTTN